MEPWTIVDAPNGRRFIVQTFAYGNPAPSPDRWRHPAETARWLVDFVRSFRAAPATFVVAARLWPAPIVSPGWRRVITGEDAAAQLVERVAAALASGAWEPGRAQPPE